MPALDPSELRGMVHLQLEKSLPFQVEDVTCNFQIVSQTESESTLMAVAVNNAQFDSLCQPLRARGLLPQKASFFAMHLGQLCPGDQAGLLIYKEDEHLVLAIYEKRKLSYVQVLPPASVSELVQEIPAILFRAELDGVSTDFPSVFLDSNLPEMESGLKELLSLPVQIVSIEQGKGVGDCELLPESFLRERQQRNQTARLKSNLVTAAIGYFMLLATAFACLIWLQFRVNKLDARIQKLNPDIEFVKKRVARWEALAPAIERDRFVVELLFQVCKSSPSDGIRITEFEASKDQFMVKAEAPNLGLAVDFGNQLKANPALQSYHFDTPPAMFANDRAIMNITGKL